MSGFTADWLALREPADHAARNGEVAARLRGHFARRAALTVVDLGCGTGSNLRGLAPMLPLRQHWHLIDGDRALLEEARRRLGAWADSAGPSGTGLRLRKGEREIEVRFDCADLTARALDFADIGAELVTAAALFDLVSQAWLERLVAGLAGRQIPLYAVLNYDGAAHWRPADPLDASVVAAFNRHQRGDKGFGPALGPAAGAALVHLLKQRGYTAWSGDSPWELGATQTGLIAALAAGFAEAAGAIEPARGAAFAGWAARRAAARAVTIGHRDIFAHP